MNSRRDKAIEILQEAMRQTSTSAARLSAWAEVEEISADRYGAILGQLRELDDNGGIDPLLNEARIVADRRVDLCERIATDYHVTRQQPAGPTDSTL